MFSQFFCANFSRERVYSWWFLRLLHVWGVLLGSIGIWFETLRGQLHFENETCDLLKSVDSKCSALQKRDFSWTFIYYINVLMINIWRGIDIARKIKSFHAHLYSGEIIWKIVFDSKKFLNSCNLKYFKKYHLSWAVLIFGQEVSQITAGAVVCQTICWSFPVSKDIYFRYMFKIDRK